jgi:hypothetical protein
MSSLSYVSINAVLVSMSTACSIDWNPNCNFVASGSGDNAIVLYTPDTRGSSGGASNTQHALSYVYRREGAHSADINAVR